MSVSRAEELLAADLRDVGLSPEREFRFHTVRRWRFDFAWPQIRLAIEIDGSGAHTHDRGKRLDQQKRNAALELGWRVLAYPARETVTAKRRERIVEQIQRVFCGESDELAAAYVLDGDPPN